MIELNHLRTAATVLLLRQAKCTLEILLVKRSADLKFGANRWVFPGGKADEKDLQGSCGMVVDLARNTAVRECSEETGIELFKDDLILFHQNIIFNSFEKLNTFWFAVDYQRGKYASIDGDEIVDFEWMSPTVALDKHERKLIDIMPNTMALINLISDETDVIDAIQSLRGPS